MKKWFPLVIVSIGTIGLMAYIINDAFFSELTNPFGAIRLFKYFTMLSNVIAVVYFWLVYNNRTQLKYPWFDRLLGGIVIYLTITFAIYAILLEATYQVQGLDLIGNITLHYINPILVVGYLLIYRKDFTFTYKDIGLWIMFPVAYLIFMVVHGLITGDYLYPFFQVSEVGVVGLISMIGILLGIFFLLSIAIVKIVSRK